MQTPEKVFVARPKTSGYSHRIYIQKSNFDILDHATFSLYRAISALSVCGWNTSGNPDEYMFEFAYSGVEYAKAIAFLHDAGYNSSM